MKLEKNQFKKLFIVKKTIKRMKIKSNMIKKSKENEIAKK
jgi:hypothetical protein